MTFYSTPESFFQIVSSLDNQDDVIDYCIELLEYLENVIHSRGDTYKISTISKMLSAYRKPFYSFISPLDSLNEIVEIREYRPNGEFTHTFKKGSRKHGVEAGESKRYSIISKKQHVAGNLLALSRDQLLELVDSRIDSLLAKETIA